MKRVTRKQIKSWLTPMRRCFAEIKSGEVDAIQGYAVTRDHQGDYARIDWALCGFRALLDRLCSQIDTGPLERIEKKLASGVPLTVAEIDAALALLHRCEDALIKHPAADLKAAVLTKEICIEMDEMGMREAA